MTSIEFDPIAAPLPANDPDNFLYYIDCDAGPSHTWSVKDYNDPTVLVDRWGDPPGTQVTLKQAVDACDPMVGPALKYRSGGPDDMLITIQLGKTLENDWTVIARHVPQHETGHTVGLSHENKRTDGSSVVSFYAGCVGGEPAAFSPANMSSMRILTRYDGDLFSAALAAGDLDGDGADDLIVGSPETGTAAGAGHVYVFRQGGPSGFPAELPVAEPSSPASHDRFGEAIAFGRFAFGGGPALAIGAPGLLAQQGVVWRLALAFGPAGLSVAEAQSIDAAQAGLVAAAGNEFGQVLAVGVPRYGAQAGKVVLLRNNGSSLVSWQLRSAPGSS